MAKKKKALAPLTAAEAASHFTRGAVAAGLLALLRQPDAAPPAGRDLLRLMAQAGSATACGMMTAESLRRGQYSRAALALAGGAAAIAAASLLLPPNSSHPETEDHRV
jgi:hypothetical protein